MDQNKNRHKNELVLYRRRMNFPQKQVAALLGHRDTSMLSRYENGRSFPPLLTALRLEIVYRVPVAFLYPDLYMAMREEIRNQETRFTVPCQTALF